MLEESATKIVDLMCNGWGEEEVDKIKLLLIEYASAYQVQLKIREEAAEFNYNYIARNA